MAMLLKESLGLNLMRLEVEDLERAQMVFSQTPSYHLSVMGKPAPLDIAQRCFDASPPPAPRGLRNYKHFVGFSQDARGQLPFMAIADVMVGVPRYDIATVATFLVPEGNQRRGWGRRSMHLLLRWLRSRHPVLRWVDVSVLDENVAAVRFLRSLEFARADYSSEVEVRGEIKRLSRFELGVS